MTNTFDFQTLQRFPDLEANNLVAVDATDRLVLAEAAVAIEGAGPGRVVVLGDNYGAMTLGAMILHGAKAVRVHQDSLIGEQALANNAGLVNKAGLSDDAGLVNKATRVELTNDYSHLGLGPELFAGATVVLGQLPKSLDALREITQLVAAHADPAVEVFLGGRVKHMTRAMNTVLADSFDQVRASLAQQKSRVLLASGPRADRGTSGTPYPLRAHHHDLDLWVCAHGAAFAGTKLDLGTRFLLELMDRMRPGVGTEGTAGTQGADRTAGTAVDLGCGTGIIAAALARARPQLNVIATDLSAAAVSSALATMAANDVGDRVQVLRDDAMSTLPDASVDLVVCNPPFHQGTSVDTRGALKLFEAAGRVLRPGGELWTVFNSHLPYLDQLGSAVGPTRIAGRNPKFTVTVSTRSAHDRPAQDRRRQRHTVQG